MTIHTFQHGDFRCMVIKDGGHVAKAETLFTNAPSDELEPALASGQLDRNHLPSSWTCLLVDTGDSKVLVDTGIGKGAQGFTGTLADQLAQQEIEATSIDHVFLSHGHPDHIGGCADADGNPVFANATYMMGATEYEFWTDEANLAGLSDLSADLARKNLPQIRDQLELLQPGDEIAPGMRALSAFGHTPGHLGLEITSTDSRLLFLADAALHPIHLAHPEWVAKQDMDPKQVALTRRELLQNASEEQALIIFFHFEFPSLGHVVPKETGWSWIPLK